MKDICKMPRNKFNKKSSEKLDKWLWIDPWDEI